MTSSTPTSCGSTSIPVPGVAVDADPRGGARRARGARGPRAHRLAEDVRLARHPRLRPHRARVGLLGGPPRGPGAGARGRTPRTGDRHQQVVEGGAPRRVPGLQPERQGPHGRVGVLGAADAGRAGLDAADAGTRCPTRELGEFTIGTHAGPIRAARRRRTPASTMPSGRWTGCWSCRRATRRPGLGDAPWPPNYAKRRASRRGFSRRSAAMVDPRPATDPSAPRGRAGSVAPASASASLRRSDGTVSRPAGVAPRSR